MAAGMKRHMKMLQRIRPTEAKTYRVEEMPRTDPMARIARVLIQPHSLKPTAESRASCSELCPLRRHDERFGLEVVERVLSRRTLRVAGAREAEVCRRESAHGRVHGRNERANFGAVDSNIVQVKGGQLTLQARDPALQPRDAVRGIECVEHAVNQGAAVTISNPAGVESKLDQFTHPRRQQWARRHRGKG
eukprot:scaffold4549_cov136-Isochrysis_galbana.AAC.2